MQLSVRPQLLTEEQEQKIKEVLGEKSEIFSMSEINFVNTLDGEGWEPEQLVKVKLPMVELGDYETAVVVHRKEDGSLEFLDGKISGSDIVFQASEFSEYGIAGMMGDTASLLDASGKEEPEGSGMAVCSGRRCGCLLPAHSGAGAACGEEA